MNQTAPSSTRRSKWRGALSDKARFLKALIGNPAKTGAVSPSGKALARTMAAYVDLQLDGPVIELGPGTGPITNALVARGIAPERLILIEYDPVFCALLRERFPGATVIQGDAYDLPGTLAGLAHAPAAAVVSGLPLLNRPEADRFALLRAAFHHMQPQGRFIQFTYGMVSPLPPKKTHRDGFTFCARASAPIWLNIPPARVWVYTPAMPQDTDRAA